MDEIQETLIPDIGSVSSICEQVNELSESGQYLSDTIDSIMEAAIKGDSAVLRNELFPIVAKSLAKKDNQVRYTSIIDKYLAKNTESYSSIGPSTRPSRNPSEVAEFILICGLTEEMIKTALTKVAGNNPAWKNFNTPYMIAIVLSIRYFGKVKDQKMLHNSLLFLVTNIYQFMFNKYYPRFEPNQMAMAYTIANLSQRYKVKKSTTILGTIMDVMNVCYETHKQRLEKGTDIDFLKFINDATSRINSLMKNICIELNENLKEGKYLQSEHEDFTDEGYYEADSDSYVIDRITNKVLTNLVVSGPDRRLVEMAARNSEVSVNMLQTYILTLSAENNRDDIRAMIERLLALYLNDNSGANAADIKTNKFYVYCIKVYRQSNTVNKNIIEIKKILDKWTVELDIKSKTTSPGQLGNYRKAIFLFFIFTIEKLA